LHERGILKDAESEQLKEAYRFLRRCESVMRRYENKAVSALPSDPTEQQKLAIRAGYDSFEVFQRKYVDARDAIHTLYERRSLVSKASSST
jgi:glutamate-ammonia-ligase adenylyltransferase